MARTTPSVNFTAAPDDVCRCGHAFRRHHHGKSCSEIVDVVRFRYCRCERFSPSSSKEVKSETEEATVPKSSKKRARITGNVLFAALSSKVETSPLRKKIRNPECKSHTPIVAQVLLLEGRPMDLKSIVAAAKKTGRYKTDADMEKLVKGDLGILVREGLVKATVEDKGKAA
jgi:hypothetical protein